MSGVKICAVTGSRAEFGQLLPLLRKLEEDDFFDLDLVVTGSHLSGGQGSTIDEIESSGIPVAERIPITGLNDNSRPGIASQIGEVSCSFSSYFDSHRPDLLIAIGDRYEMFGVGIAASTLLIPICHICGGSTTSGAIDEIYRHSLTKMSNIHFTTCDTYRKRVIQLGENPGSVFNVGSLAIENCLKAETLPRNDLLGQLGMDVEKPYCVVTFHPVTLEAESSEGELRELIAAFDMNPHYQYLITLSNADSGGDLINRIWTEEGRSRRNFFVVSSLGMKRYLTALKYSEMMIGNSSSGTTEGPAMKIPVIDIGDRQKGREFSACAIHCEPDRLSIDKAMKKAETREFREIAHNVVNPFGDGSTSEKMISVLKTSLSKGIDVKKDFFDIRFDIK
ncbi:MAG: UDP-N-acetylglucosamine 2-epimerase (hydrolyzing) [Lachnospiraceae bacterium]|nr:UDP-N-acetylglucosamine 2-epimerase (hydrolyzing) [Lachnospiraceae bacterium]